MKPGVLRSNRDRMACFLVTLVATAFLLPAGRVLGAEEQGKTAREWFEHYLPSYMEKNRQWRKIHGDPEKLKAIAPKDGDSLEYMKRAVGIFSGYQGEFGASFGGNTPIVVGKHDIFVSRPTEFKTGLSRTVALPPLK